MRPQLPALSSLRFIAAIHVYLFHLSAFKLAQGPALWQRFVSTAAINVDMFFVLSGFILVYSYMNKDFSFKEFWWSRFTRIYPAYFTALLLSLPIFLFVLFKVELTPELAWIAWFKNNLLVTMGSVLTLTQAWIPSAALGWNSVSWSLSVEAFFYLMFPLTFFLLFNRTNKALIWTLVLCWFVSLVIPISYSVLQPDGVARVTYEMNDLFWFNVVRFNPLVRLPEFVIGMCTGFLFLRSSIKKSAATPLVFSALAILLTTIYFSPFIPYQVLHNGLLAPAFAMIVYGFSLRPRWIHLLEFRWLTHLGEASYSFYLTHSLVIAVVFQPSGNQYQPQALWRHGLCLVVALGLSILLYRGVERPALRLLRKFSTRKRVSGVENAPVLTLST